MAFPGSGWLWFLRGKGGGDAEWPETCGWWVNWECGCWVDWAMWRLYRVSSVDVGWPGICRGQVGWAMWRIGRVKGTKKLARPDSNLASLVCAYVCVCACVCMLALLLTKMVVFLCVCIQRSSDHAVTNKWQSERMQTPHPDYWG